MYASAMHYVLIGLDKTLTFLENRFSNAHSKDDYFHSNHSIAYRDIV